MCQIISCIQGVPSVKQLEEAAEKNSNGAGIAWVEGEKVHWEKGLKGKEAVKAVLKGNLPFPFVVHFRKTSIGGDHELLTHPFALDEHATTSLKGESSEGVLFHNGTWGMWDNKVLDSLIGGNRRLPDGPWNDSRGIAYLVAHHGMGIFNLLTFGGGRVLILKPDKRMRFFGEWTPEEEKSWYHSAPLDSGFCHIGQVMDLQGKGHGSWTTKVANSCSQCGGLTIGPMMWCNSCKNNKAGLQLLMAEKKAIETGDKGAQEKLAVRKVQELYVRVRNMRKTLWGEVNYRILPKEGN